MNAEMQGQTGVELQVVCEAYGLEFTRKVEIFGDRPMSEIRKMLEKTDIVCPFVESGEIKDAAGQVVGKFETDFDNLPDRDSRDEYGIKQIIM